MKAVVTSLDDVPEALRDQYEEKDGKFLLKIDGDIPGFAPKTKLDEFRTNNTSLMKERDALKADLEKFSGVDREEYERLKKEREEAGDKKLLDEGKIDELIEERTTRMREDHVRQVKALEEARDKEAQKATMLDGRLSSQMIDRELQDMAIKRGVRKEAMPDVLFRGRAIFKQVDGKLVPMNGNDVIFGKNGSDPMTPDEWGDTLMGDAPHLFDPSSGGSAGGSDDTGGGKSVSRDQIESNAIGKNLEGFATGQVKVA